MPSSGALVKRGREDSTPLSALYATGSETSGTSAQGTNGARRKSFHNQEDKPNIIRRGDPDYPSESGLIAS